MPSIAKFNYKDNFNLEKFKKNKKLLFKHPKGLKNRFIKKLK